MPNSLSLIYIPWIVSLPIPFYRGARPPRLKTHVLMRNGSFSPQPRTSLYFFVVNIMPRSLSQIGRRICFARIIGRRKSIGNFLLTGETIQSGSRPLSRFGASESARDFTSCMIFFASLFPLSNPIIDPNHHGGMAENQRQLMTANSAECRCTRKGGNFMRL